MLHSNDLGYIQALGTTSLDNPSLTLVISRYEPPSTAVYADESTMLDSASTSSHRPSLKQRSCSELAYRSTTLWVHDGFPQGMSHQFSKFRYDLCLVFSLLSPHVFQVPVVNSTSMDPTQHSSVCKQTKSS